MKISLLNGKNEQMYIHSGDDTFSAWCSEKFSKVSRVSKTLFFVSAFIFYTKFKACNNSIDKILRSLDIFHNLMAELLKFCKR